MSRPYLDHFIDLVAAIRGEVFIRGELGDGGVSLRFGGSPREILASVDRIRASLACLVRPEHRASFSVTFGAPVPKERARMTPYQMDNESKVTVTLSPKTPSGKVVAIDGPVQWSVPDGDATVIDISADGLTATLVSGADGVSHILATGDAQPGQGVTTISETIELTVVDPMASSFGVAFGNPVPK
jgi:hypothetical protein